jgi:hypothetical protein
MLEEPALGPSAFRVIRCHGEKPLREPLMTGRDTNFFIDGIDHSIYIIDC